MNIHLNSYENTISAKCLRAHKAFYTIAHIMCLRETDLILLFFLSQFPIIFLSIKRVFYFVKIKSLISDLSQGTESSVDNICLGMKNGNDKYNV